MTNTMKFPYKLVFILFGLSAIFSHYRSLPQSKVPGHSVEYAHIYVPILRHDLPSLFHTLLVSGNVLCDLK